MAGEIAKDILIRIASQKGDLSAINEAILALEKMEAATLRISGLPFSVPGFDQFTSQVKNSASEVQGLGSTGARSFEKIGDAALSAKDKIRAFAEQTDAAVTKQVERFNVNEKGESSSAGFSLTGKDKSKGITERRDYDEEDQLTKRTVTTDFAAVEKAEAKRTAALEAEVLKREELYHKEQEERALLEAKGEAEFQAILNKGSNEAIVAQEKYTAALEAEVLKQESIHRKSQDRIASEEAASIQKAHGEANREDSQRNASNSFQGAIAGGAKVGQTELTVGDDGKIQKIRTAFDEATGATYRLNEATGKLSISQKQLGQDFEESSGSIVGAAGKVLVWTLATGAVFGAIRSIGGAIASFRELEDATVSLARVGQGFAATGAIPKANADILASARQVTFALQDLKVQYSSTGGAADQAAITFAKLGLSQTQVIEATKSALQAELLSGVDAAKSAELLSTAFQSFRGSASDIPDILGKVNTVTQTTRVGMDQLFEAIQRGGEVFHEAGGTLEQFVATTAVVSQVTGRSGSEIGNALKFISSRLGDATVQEKLFAESGIQIRDIEGNLKPIIEIFGELNAKIQTVSKAQQEDIEITVGGTRQRNILRTALEQYYEIQQKVIDQYTASNNVERDAKELSDTLSGAIKGLIAAFEKLGATIVGGGIGQALTSIAKTLTSLVQFLGDFGGAVLISIGALAAYVAALYLANGGAVALSASLTSTITRFAAANATLFGFTSNLASATVASQAATASIYELDAALSANVVDSVAAAGGMKVWGAAAAEAGAETAAAGAASALALGPIVIVLAAITAGFYAAAAGREHFNQVNKVDFSKDSDFGKRTGPDTEEAKKSANQSGADKTRADVAKNAILELKNFESEEERGNKGSIERQQERLRLGQEIAKALQLEGDSRAKALAGELTSNQVTELEASFRAKSVQELQRSVDLQTKIVNQYGPELARAEQLLKVKEAAADAEAKLEEIRAKGNLILPTSSTPEQIKLHETVDAGKTINESLPDLRQKVEQGRQAKAALETDTKSLEAKQRQDALDAKGLGIGESQLTLQKKIAEAFNSIEEKSAGRLDAAANETEKYGEQLNIIKQKQAFLNSDSVITKDRDNPVLNADIKLEDKKLAEEAHKAELAFQKAPIKAAAKIDFENLKDDLNLQKKLAERFAEATAPKDQRELARVGADLQTNKLQQGALDKDISETNVRIAQAGEGGDEGVRLLEHLKAITEEKARLEVEGHKLSNQFIDEQYATAIKITEEIKKQTAEALKARGSLSDEDLARTRILESKISRGENVKVGLNQFDNLDQTSRERLTRFQDTHQGADILGPARSDLEARGFGGKAKHPGDEISPAQLAKTIQSVGDLNTAIGKLLDTTTRNAISSANAVTLNKAPQNQHAGAPQNVGGGPAPNQTSVTVNIQGIEESVNRIGNQVATALTASLRDLGAKLGQQISTSIRVNGGSGRPKENPR